MDGGREAVGKCKNVQGNVKQVLVLIRSRERETALHVFSGPPTVAQPWSLPARSTAFPNGVVWHTEDLQVDHTLPRR